MRLHEFTEINEKHSDTLPFKASHFIKDIASRITGHNPEKHIAKIFIELQDKWGDDFDPQKALHYIVQMGKLSARDVRAWLKHSHLWPEKGHSKPSSFPSTISKRREM